jgi:hypothetical protein
LLPSQAILWFLGGGVRGKTSFFKVAWSKRALRSGARRMYVHGQKVS